MFAINERYRPCSARASRSSPERLTTTAFLSASYLTATSGRNVFASLPLGPSTRTVMPLTSTLTLAGTTTGCVPIRDTAHLSPDVANHLAPDFLGAGAAVAHQAFVRAQDRDPKSVEDRP